MKGTLLGTVSGLSPLQFHKEKQFNSLFPRLGDTDMVNRTWLASGLDSENDDYLTPSIQANNRSTKERYVIGLPSDPEGLGISDDADDCDSAT